MSKARELSQRAGVDGALSNRNLIINGAMQVAQRGTSVTGIASGNTWTADRFVSSINVGVMNQTVEQDAPDGLSNSLKFEITTAETPQSGDFIILEQRFEGQDLQRIAKGTASAQKVTLSFWVKSNKTGTYTVEFDDNDNQRSIERQYTVDASGVWEFKTVTYDEDTVGIFDNDNGFSGRLMWWLAAGSSFTSGTLATSWEATVNANRAVGNVNLADTIGNYWQITGVQLEVGDTATPFEHRSYGQELALCQRYYQVIPVADRVFSSYNNSSASYGGSFQWFVPMRVAPTSQGGGNASVYPSDSPTPVTGRQVTIQNTFTTGANVYVNWDSAGSHSAFVRADNILLDAEI